MTDGATELRDLLGKSVSGAHWINTLAESFSNAGLYFGHGTTNAADEAAWLVADTGGIDYDDVNWQAQFATLLERSLTEAEQERVIALAERRICSRQPLAYLLNRAWFYGRSYFVDERVLVPRSPIGALIDAGFEPWLDATSVSRVLDLCTGSGCLAINAAHRFPDALVHASDLSVEALEVAKINVAEHGVGDRVTLMQGDLYTALPTPEAYDVIVTNPPYVDAEEMALRPSEFRAEPELGLAAGGDGLDLARRILRDAAERLRPGGLLVMEVGASDEALQAAYPTVPFTWWLSDDQGYGILIMEREQLQAHAEALRSA